MDRIIILIIGYLIACYIWKKIDYSRHRKIHNAVLFIGAINSEIPTTCTHKISKILFKNNPVKEYETYVFNNAFHTERCFPSSKTNTSLLFQ